MMSVMLSIKPKWCELIASGAKTIEVRKTRPKIETPFRCYVYQCLPKYGDWNERDGRVIGEFVCDSIFPISITYSDPSSCVAMKEFPYTCLTDKQIIEYLGNGKRGYGWHISDLMIYDVPKELSEFRKPLTCHRGIQRDNCDGCWDCEIKRPPQSWCYCEVLEND